LTEHGRRMLQFLREHPHAPRFRNQSGNRLTAANVERVRALIKKLSLAERKAAVRGLELLARAAREIKETE